MFNARAIAIIHIHTRVILIFIFFSIFKYITKQWTMLDLIRYVYKKEQQMISINKFIHRYFLFIQIGYKIETRHSHHLHHNHSINMQSQWLTLSTYRCCWLVLVYPVLFIYRHLILVHYHYNHQSDTIKRLPIDLYFLHFIQCHT